MVVVGISGIDAQHRVGKSTIAKNVQGTQDVKEDSKTDTVIVVPKTKKEIADSLNNCYEKLLAQ